jgi:uncharacterized protein YjbI with pentapeptide repeats
MSIKSIIETEIDNFLELANLANLNVKEDFAGADLSETNLGGLDLKKANFRSTDFRKANLKNTNLRDAILVRANLQNANLQNANLSGVDFQDADLAGADLRDAQFVGAINLSSAKVINARFKNNNGISKSFELNLIRNGAYCEGILPSKQINKPIQVLL